METFTYAKLFCTTKLNEFYKAKFSVNGLKRIGNNQKSWTLELASAKRKLENILISSFLWVTALKFQIKMQTILKLYLL